MMTFILACLGGVVGSLVGCIVGLMLGMLAATLLNIPDFEGQSGYFVVFLFALPGAVIGLIGGIWLVIRSRRKKAAQPSPKNG